MIDKWALPDINLPKSCMWFFMYKQCIQVNKQTMLAKISIKFMLSSTDVKALFLLFSRPGFEYFCIQVFL